MRRVALALVLLATAAAVLTVRDEGPESRAFPADRLLFAQDDWLRAPETKLAAAALDASCGVSFGRGDLDGDGRHEAVVTYSTDGSCRNERVAVFTSGGRAVRGPVDTDVLGKIGETCPSVCRVFAIADLNSDGRDEVVLELSHGASQVQLGVYRLGSRGLVRLQTVGRAGREPARFSYYGSMCCGSHLACRGRDLVVASSYGRSIFGTLFVGETVYRFDGSRFSEITSRVYPPRAAGDRRGTGVPGRACIAPV
jgi:hypothetical protein